MQDLTVLLSFVYPQLGAAKVKIIDVETKHYNETLPTDFTYGSGSMSSSDLDCIRKWEFEKDDTIHRFGIINKSKNLLQEFDTGAISLMKLIAQGCQLTVSVIDEHKQVRDQYIFTFDNLFSMPTKIVPETIRWKSYTYDHCVLPFPTNSFGLIGIEYRAPKEGQFPIFGCLGNIEIEADAVKNFIFQHEEYSMD